MSRRIFELRDLVIGRTDLLNLARVFSDIQGTCLLYSGSKYETAAKSFLCLFPYEFVQVRQGRQMRYRGCGDHPVVLEMNNPWDALVLLMPDLGKGELPVPEWVGFFSYEMGAFSDGLKRLHYPAATPEAYWQKCAIVLSVDHRTNSGVVYFAEGIQPQLDDRSRLWVERLAWPSGWRDLLDPFRAENRDVEKVTFDYRLASPLEIRESYLSKIEKIQEWIRSGDVYQVNLSQHFEFLGSAKPLDLFLKLTHLNPAPFSAYLHLPEFSIISSSPERFLSKCGHILETRPIKGTAPRGKTVEEDQANRSALIASAKERAELLMITDLMRNDLSRISLPGSVHVPLLWGCEEYSNVFHLYSLVRSQMRPNLHPIEAVRACFPGGSITGCPKLSAMEAIAELEGSPRGIYTGAIGYFAANGDFDLNIAIRTLTATGNRLSLRLGGAIVIDSDPDQEYEETFHKGRSIFDTLGVIDA